MDIEGYIKAELLVLIPVLVYIGKMIKGTEKISDKYIPLLLGGIGIVLSLFYVLATEGFSLMAIFTAIVQGILTAAAAVYANQLFKQSKEK